MFLCIKNPWSILLSSFLPYTTNHMHMRNYEASGEESAAGSSFQSRNPSLRLS